MIDWDNMEVTEAICTAASAYDYWSTVAYYECDFDGTPVDRIEAEANAIGWASRDQSERL